MNEIITFSIKKELREKIHRLKGDIARSKFISKLLEDAITTKVKEKNNVTRE